MGKGEEVPLRREEGVHHTAFRRLDDILTAFRPGEFCDASHSSPSVAAPRRLTNHPQSRRVVPPQKALDLSALALLEVSEAVGISLLR